MKTIASAGPSISKLEIQLVQEAVQEGWYENRSKHIDQFVDEFSAYTGLKYCLPTSHCTDAIHLALLSLGVGPGDEVIVPDIAWVAVAAPVDYVKAVPVFADIDPQSWCLSPESFERAISSKTKAVIVVDLYGNMPDMDEILRIAKKNKIVVIEDAAEAMGATYKGKKAGTFGLVNVFSFNATKLMMAGQGGMFATNNKKLYELAKSYAHHGMVKYTDKTTFWSVKIGYNYQWTNIQAALALAQLRRLSQLVKERRQIFQWYKEALDDVDGITLNPQTENIFNTFWVVTAIVDSQYGWNKEDLMAAFRKQGIDTRPFFYPISSMPAYKKYSQGRHYRQNNKNAYRLSAYGISFPSAANLTKKDVLFVCKIFKKILRSK